MSIFSKIFRSAKTEKQVNRSNFRSRSLNIEPLEDRALLSVTPLNLSNTFTLHSDPDSNYAIYLDFNGHATTASIETPAFSLDDDYDNFSDAELERIQYIWSRVAEDFAPFSVDVTTEEPVLADLINSGGDDTRWGVRVVVGGTNEWYAPRSTTAGVAQMNSFDANGDIPVFAFSEEVNGSEKSIADTISHEVGHTLGLEHDGKGDQEYYFGENGWSPIMGGTIVNNDYVTQWSNGDYPGATNQQDDLAQITKYIPYKADDHGNAAETATVVAMNENSFSVNGIIETNTDTDGFKFTLSDGGYFNAIITSGTRDANLDVLTKLYRDNGGASELLQTLDPQETMGISISNLQLQAGTYYMSVTGTGRNGVYSDYGSIGTYAISANVYALSTPENLRQTAIGKDSVVVAWNTADGANAYDLRYGTDGVTWETVSVSDAHYQIANLESATYVYVQVRAVDATGNSNWSEVQQFKTDDHFEPNDSLNDAHDLGTINGLTTFENLVFAGDDYYKFTLPVAFEESSFIGVNYVTGTTDLKISILSASGSPFVIPGEDGSSYSFGYTYGDDGRGNSYWNTVNSDNRYLPAGTYIVQVSTQQAGNALNDNYSLAFNVPAVVTEETPFTVVTTLDDSDDKYDHKISLREAIRYATTNNKIITFDPSLFTGLEGEQAKITLSLGELLVDKSLTIEGPGAEFLAIDANQKSRVFSVRGTQDNQIDVNFVGLTITGGKVGTSMSGQAGGGIYGSRAIFTISDCVVANNTSNYCGGSLYFSVGVLTIENSEIFENTAHQGGGIFIDTGGVATIINSRISNNYATRINSVNYTGGHALSGGGIYVNYGSGSAVTIIDSTISGNTADYCGGGIYNYNGKMTITNSVISNNATLDTNINGSFNGDDGHGGGIYATTTSLLPGDLTITNSVISGNTATGYGGGIVSDHGFILNNVTITDNYARWGGGGIYHNIRTLILNNTIVAENTTDTDESADILKNPAPSPITVSSIIKGFNTLTTFIDWDTDSGVNYVYNPSKPLFVGMLEENGTYDYHLAENSQAIDQGDNSLIPEGIATDIEGNARIYNNGTVDIGAYESEYVYVFSPYNDFIGDGDDETPDYWDVDTNWLYGHVPTSDETARIPVGYTVIVTTFTNEETKEHEANFPKEYAGAVVNEGTIQTEKIYANNIAFTGAVTNIGNFVVEATSTSFRGGYTQTTGSLLAKSLDSNRGTIVFASNTEITGGSISTEIGGGLTASNGATVNVSSDVNVSADNASILVLDGATFNFDGLTSYATTENNMFRVTGAGSTLNLSSLTSFSASELTFPLLLIGGGNIDLSGLTTLGESRISLNLLGDNNSLDLSGLTDTALSNSGIYLTGSGNTLNLGEITELNGSVLALTILQGYADYSDYTFENFTKVTDSDIGNTTGKTLSLPNLTDYVVTGVAPGYNPNATYVVVDAYGENSVINLPALENVTVNAGGLDLIFAAENGGTLKIDHLTTLTPEGTAQLVADGAGSVIDARLLETRNENVTVAETNGGKVLLHEEKTAIVTTELDIVDPTDGLISLREAIAYATAGNEITFADNVQGKTIALNPNRGRLLIEKSLVIDGTAKDITINGNSQTGVFETNSGSANVVIDVTIKGLTIANGYNSGLGAGLYARYTNLTLQDILFTNNVAYDGGAALYIGFGYSYATLENVSFVGNYIGAGSSGGGGAISIQGSAGVVNINNCWFQQNSAGNGGAITANAGNFPNVFEVNIANSTFTGNTANYSAGAIQYRGGTLNVSNTLFAENSVPTTLHNSSGGAIVLRSIQRAAFTNCTIAGNTASYAAGIDASSAGGDGNVVLNNTIVAGNIAIGSAPNSIDVNGKISGNNNLIGIGTGVYEIQNNVNGNIVGTAENPIDPLFVDAEHGDYHLAEYSQAIDRGNDALAVDAEGNLLVYDLAGNARIQGNAVDIGAYEGTEAPNIETPSTIVTTEYDVVNPYDNEISLREALQYTAKTGDFTVTFDESLNGKTIRLSRGEIVLDKTLTIDGSGVNVVIDAKQQSRVFVVTRNANVTLVGLTVTGGVAYPTQFVNASYGGGIYNQGILTIISSKITGNFAQHGGGGIYNVDGTLTIVNCLLTGNVAQGSGGGLWNDAGSDKVNIANSTITNNIATNGSGSGIYTTNVIMMNNAIVAGNADSNYYPDIYGRVHGNNNLSSYAQWQNRLGNIVYDSSQPLFIDVANGDYRLIEGSQAVNAGNNAMVTAGLAKDIEGNDRIQGGFVDIGAYESPYAVQPIFVTTELDTSDPSDGLTSLREAIAEAKIGRPLVIFDESLAGKTIHLIDGEIVIDKAVQIDAGNLNITIDADQKSRALVVRPNANVTLIGLTVAGGDAIVNQSQIETFPYGGGIYNRGALTILNSKITGNFARTGGGIYNQGALTILNSKITGNFAQHGGGIYNDNGGTLTITNTLIDGNIAEYEGGGLRFLSIIQLTITNSTITNNETRYGIGSGIFFTSSAMTTISNTIIAGNRAINGDYPDVNSPVIGNNNLLSSLFNDDDDNFIYDPSLPLFVDAANGDYRLVKGSQGIDRGNNSLAVDAEGNTLVYDLAGNARVQGNAVDIGAYESPYQFPDAPLLTLVDAAENSVTLEWTEQKDVTVYTLQYKASGDDWSQVELTTISNNTTSYIVTGLTPSTAYQFRLIAWYNGKKSEDSNEIIVETKAAAPTSLVVTTSDDSENPNDNVTSLREAIELINTRQSEFTTIAFDAGLFTDGAASIQLADELPAITTALTINGTGVTLVAAEDKRILTIDANEQNNNIEIVGLTFAGGFMLARGGYGGAVYQIGGNVTLTGVTFENNSAKLGGAYFQKAGTSEFINATFTGNRSNYGGAIYLYSGTSTFRDNESGQTTFANNTAKWGGAIYLHDGTVNLHDVTLADNKATWGGAIYQLSGTLDATGGISLLRNEAQWGGGLYVTGGSVELTVLEFEAPATTTRFGTALATKSVGTRMTINGHDAALIKYLDDFSEFIIDDDVFAT